MESPSALRRFTTREYHRMLEAGILASGERVELLAGEIREAAAVGSRHAACVRRLEALFHDRLGRRVLVSVQNPVELSEDSEPEPDLALLARRADFYAAAHPRPAEVLLLVEVSDASYDADVGRKLPLYAGAGIGELWIVDLAADRIEVHLDPAGDRYSRIERFVRGDRLAPRLFPETRLPVADVLP